MREAEAKGCEKQRRERKDPYMKFSVEPNSREESVVDGADGEEREKEEEEDEMLTTTQ